MVKLSSDLVKGRFQRRLNRFSALVEVSGKVEMVHIANSGRLGELLIPDYEMLLTPVNGVHRKCPYDLTLIDTGKTLVSLDSRLPNLLFEEAFKIGSLSDFTGYQFINREITYGESRIDILLHGLAGDCFVETKSGTLVENDIARFPDAPTARGVKHLNHLSDAKSNGYDAAIVFVIQRSDASSFQPDYKSDPDFVEALERAVKNDVKVFAYSCDITNSNISLSARIPVDLRRTFW